MINEVNTMTTKLFAYVVKKCWFMDSLKVYIIHETYHFQNSTVCEMGDKTTTCKTTFVKILTISLAFLKPFCIVIFMVSTGFKKFQFSSYMEVFDIGTME